MDEKLKREKMQKEQFSMRGMNPGYSHSLDVIVIGSVGDY